MIYDDDEMISNDDDGKIALNGDDEITLGGTEKRIHHPRISGQPFSTLPAVGLSPASEGLAPWSSSLQPTIAIVLVATATILIAAWFFASFLRRRVRHKKSKIIARHVETLNRKDIDIVGGPTGGFHGTHEYDSGNKPYSQSTLGSSRTTSSKDEFGDEDSRDKHKTSRPPSVRSVVSNDSLLWKAISSVEFMHDSDVDNDEYTNGFGLMGKDDDSMDCI